MSEVIVIVSLVIIFILVLLILISIREQIPEGIESSFFTSPFYKIGRFIYRKLFEEKDRQSSYYQKLYDAKRVLNPVGRTSEEVELYFIKKTGMCFLILFVGLVLINLKNYMDSKETLIDGGQIERGAAGERDYSFQAVVTFEDEDIILSDYEVDVASREYTAEEIDAMMDSFYKELDKTILGDNESVDFVNSDIHLPTSISGYPFSIEYEWDEKSYINSRGELGIDIPSEGAIVTFDVSVKYLEYEKRYMFAMHVFPRSVSRIDYLKSQIDQSIESINEDTGTTEYMKLPDEVDGMKVIWSEKKENNLIIFLLLVVAGIIGIFVAGDKDLYKKVDERNEQMMEDYAEIVSKLTLLIGAGMTVRGAWRKIALDYKAKRDDGISDMATRYAYEEMLLTVYEMDNGVEETVCYSRFSSRARVQKYVKLVSLLDQNLKLGSSTMLSTLREEAKDASESRKNQVEKKGEEAGTKLLVPMVLMLVVVVVVIMFPAFMSM